MASKNIQNFEELEDHDVLELYASDDEIFRFPEQSEDTNAPKTIYKRFSGNLCNTPESKDPNIICSICFHQGHRSSKCRCTYYQYKEMDDFKAIEAAKKELKRLFPEVKLDRQVPPTKKLQYTSNADKKSPRNGKRRTRRHSSSICSEKINKKKSSKELKKSSKSTEVRILVNRNVRSWN